MRVTTRSKAGVVRSARRAKSCCELADGCESSSRKRLTSESVSGAVVEEEAEAAAEEEASGACCSERA